MEQRIMKRPEDVEALVKEAFSSEEGEFRPCAYFDDRLDCIRVIARDCSVYEERVNDRLTVLIDNYHDRPGRRKYVGFTIKGAKHFCQEHDLARGAPIKMTQLLDAVLASSPEPSVMFVVDLIARPLVEEEHIEAVEIPTGSTPVPA
jgi:hypothetical protein